MGIETFHVGTYAVPSQHAAVVVSLYLRLNKLNEVAATEWAGHSLSRDIAALRTAVAEQMSHPAVGRTASGKVPRKGWTSCHL